MSLPGGREEGGSGCLRRTREVDAESESGRCTLGRGPPSSQRWQRENCDLEV